MKAFIIVVKDTYLPVTGLNGKTIAYNSRFEVEEKIKNHPGWDDETHAIVMIDIDLKVK